MTLFLLLLTALNSSIPDEFVYPEFPAVLTLVGHCGYIQLDPRLLSVEISDAWATWGDPEARRTGICNFCRRCNP